MWDLLVARDDLRHAEVREAPPVALQDGEARFVVESFALTSNNITYGAMGDAFGYWKFFPAPEGFGRIPVWGHARVVESRSAVAPVGMRVFGYLPMSTEVVMRPSPGGGAPGGFVDAVEHRSSLPPTYNAYSAAAGDTMEDHRSVLRPLFMTSYLLDAQLGETPLAAVVLSSASSKTAMGLAWLLAARGVPVVGLTSERGRAALVDKGLYTDLLTYAEIDRLDVAGPAAFVDFAGDAQVVTAVHQRLGERISVSLIVGATHWEGARERGALPGAQPVLFFAPDVIRRLASGGEGARFFAGFDRRMAEFVEANPWLKIVTRSGADGLRRAYAEVVEGRAAPDEGIIIRPGAP